MGLDPHWTSAAGRRLPSESDARITQSLRDPQGVAMTMSQLQDGTYHPLWAQTGPAARLLAPAAEAAAIACWRAFNGTPHFFPSYGS
jgi:hypothetical protein